jgi:hypothetical protein
MMAMAQIINEIAHILETHGKDFDGGDAMHYAEDWNAYGFSANNVSAWCAVGVWDAGSASDWTIAGLTPENVVAAATLLLTNHDSANYAGHCPIYSTCNGDTDTSVIVDAHRLIVG